MPEGERVAMTRAWGMIPEGERVAMLKSWEMIPEGERVYLTKPWAKVSQGERINMLKAWMQNNTSPAQIEKAIQAETERSSGFVGQPRPSEGRPATWTNRSIMEAMTKPGVDAATRKEAVIQAVNRSLPIPPNMRYLYGDLTPGTTFSNPRSISKFTPTGTPITIK